VGEAIMIDPGDRGAHSSVHSSRIESRIIDVYDTQTLAHDIAGRGKLTRNQGSALERIACPRSVRNLRIYHRIKYGCYRNARHSEIYPLGLQLLFSPDLPVRIQDS